MSSAGELSIISNSTQKDLKITMKIVRAERASRRRRQLHTANELVVLANNGFILIESEGYEDFL